MSTDHLLKAGALLLLLVPGLAAVGHVLGGLLALALGKDEEIWMRRGEIVLGSIGLGAWIGVTAAILSQS